MKNIVILISAITAFGISAGGSMAVALVTNKGVMPDKTVWLLCVVIGFVSAAKDTRSLLKLPPVNDDQPKP